ncbi:MAG TPA: hypothetical protein VGG33_14790, partial [Polyangia bacterium]
MSSAHVRWVIGCAGAALLAGLGACGGGDSGKLPPAPPSNSGGSTGSGSGGRTGSGGNTSSGSGGSS